MKKMGSNRDQKACRPVQDLKKIVVLIMLAKSCIFFSRAYTGKSLSEAPIFVSTNPQYKKFHAQN